MINFILLFLWSGSVPLSETAYFAGVTFNANNISPISQRPSRSFHRVDSDGMDVFATFLEKARDCDSV